MSQRVIIGLLMAAIVGLSEPGQADDRLSTVILGQKLTGTVDKHKVIADLDGVILTVYGTDSSCQRDYYVQTGAHSMQSAQSVTLDACDMWLCTNRELRKICKQPDKKQVNCRGSIEYQQGTLIRIVVDYENEVWKVPGCVNLGPESESAVIILNLPQQSAPQGPKSGGVGDCATLGALYLGSDTGRKLHPECR